MPENNPKLSGEFPLADRIRKGDSAAEEIFVETYGRGLYLMLLKRTGNPVTADDLAQDALLTSLLALRNGKLRETEKLAGFVHGIAKNIFLRHLRTKSKENREVPLPSDIHLQSPPPSQWDSDHWRQVSRALERLDTLDQEILRLTLVEGTTLQEIADRMGLSHSLVRKRKSRAIKKLSEFIKRRSQK